MMRIRAKDRAQPGYVIPRIDVQFSGTLQNLPGPAVTTTNALTNAFVQPALGRPLSGGAATITVPYIEPNTVYSDRLTQIDLRMSKILRFGRTRSTLSLDLYNLTNSNTILTYSTTCSQFGVPATILQPRLMKFTAQFDF